MAGTGAITEAVHAYLPIDRRQALLDGVELPTAVSGSALEGDLSGFTALTEALAREFSEQRGGGAAAAAALAKGQPAQAVERSKAAWSKAQSAMPGA